MQDNDCWAKAMTWAAAGVFSLTLVVVLFAFQPARELICSRYEVKGVERMLAFIRGNETNCLWGLLYDFQTLITGLAAVTAAAFTIRKMETVDYSQGDRHRELVILQLRQDKIRMQRALRPQLNELEEWLSGLDVRVLHAPMKAGRSGDPMWNQLADFGRRGLDTLKEIKNTLERKQFRDGVSLFDGHTTWTLDQLDSILGSTIDAVEKHLDVDKGALDSFALYQYQADFKEFGDALRTNVYFCVQISEQLVDDLKRHAVDYDV
jgi:hypothetical protein